MTLLDITLLTFLFMDFWHCNSPEWQETMIRCPSWRQQHWKINNIIENTNLLVQTQKHKHDTVYSSTCITCGLFSQLIDQCTQQSRPWRSSRRCDNQFDPVHTKCRIKMDPCRSIMSYGRETVLQGDKDSVHMPKTNSKLH